MRDSWFILSAWFWFVLATFPTLLSNFYQVHDSWFILSAWFWFVLATYSDIIKYFFCKRVTVNYLLQLRLFVLFIKPVLSTLLSFWFWVVLTTTPILLINFGAAHILPHLMVWYQMIFFLYWRGIRLRLDWNLKLLLINVGHAHILQHLSVQYQ